MARLKNTFWHRNKFNISALILGFSGYYFYQSLYPKFPESWESKSVGPYIVSPMPLNLEPPYFHDDVYTKDFLLMVEKGAIANIRQGYLTIGETALPLAELQKDHAGIIHGSAHSQEAHAFSPPTLTAQHKLWLTIQDWQGNEWVESWELPVELTKQ